MGEDTMPNQDRDAARSWAEATETRGPALEEQEAPLRKSCFVPRVPSFVHLQNDDGGMISSEMGVVVQGRGKEAACRMWVPCGFLDVVAAQCGLAFDMCNSFASTLL